MTNLAAAVERNKRCFVACAPEKECECRERIERQAMTDKELSEFGIDEALLGLRHLLSELPDHDFRLERHGLESGIEALLAMNNRLAELGRGADRKLEQCPDGCCRPKATSADDCATGCCSKWYAVRDKAASDECEKLAAFWKRPPVAGLAELTDAQLVELFDYIEVARGNAAQKHWASSETMQSWEARRKVVIAKAALQAGAGDGEDTARIDYLETLRGDMITGTSDDQELVGHDWVIYGQFYTVREALDYGMMKRQEAIDNAQDTERK